MTARDELIAKIRRLPGPMVQQVNDYVDFLLTKRGGQGMRRSQTLTGKSFFRPLFFKTTSIVGVHIEISTFASRR